MDSELRNKDGLTEKEFLLQYRPGDYERPSVTVDILLFTVDPELNSLKLLLIKRGNHPYMNCWALPGGFVDMDESAFTAANRELKEETGLEGIYLEQLYTYSQPGRDPRMRVISIAYIALIPMTEAVAGDDATDTEWFDISMDSDRLLLTSKEKDITIEYLLKNKTFESGMITYDNQVPQLKSKSKLAFDHNLIIYDGLMRLRNKADYTDIVFNLMGEQFTLPDLQRVYEMVLGRKLYKKNFRDKIKDKVVNTGEEGKSIKGNKMSALYSYKK
ncbi:MAG: NUDIX hydrolase [Clostridiales bacterium]|nr:NUDIX hydrolase [Clostridiales bacterium]